MDNNFGEVMSNILKQMEEERYLLSHPFVGTEHLVLALLKKDTDIKNIFHKDGIDYKIFKDELIKIVGIPNKNVDYNLYTPLLKRVISNAIYDAKEFSKDISGKLLISSLIEEGEGVAIRILLGLNVDINNLFDKLNKSSKDVISEKIEFGINLNNTVDMNENVIGRQKEINFIIETLLRKKKNNPLLIGEAGVGKTAIVEELARLINNNKVPNNLKGYNIISLEMSSLISGTKYRGEFEEKLTKIISSIQSSNKTILFIDEIHTMVSAGGAEGAISAGDILKPYLARGNIKCIGATTTDEYDKYIAKDKALSRRFEIIKVVEPNIEETVDILTKIKGEYESYHNVVITDDNINLIVNLCDKYIYNKKNPDKSIDFLDTVSSIVSIDNDSNQEVDKLLERLDEIKVFKERCVINDEYDKAVKYLNDEKNIKDEIKNITSNNSYKITDKDIYNVLEKKSSIPSLINKDKLINDLKNNLYENVIGQDDVVKNIINLFSYKINNLDKTMMCLFEGSTGTGKSLVVDVIRKSLNKIHYIKINGNDYINSSNITKLIGTTAGYVGYNDYYVFRDIKEYPYSLIVVDNFNKMSDPIKGLFKQISDDGCIENSKGEVIKFNNSIIIGMNTTEETNKIGFCDTNNKVIDKDYIFEDVIKFNSISKDVYNLFIQKNKLNIPDEFSYDYKKLGLKNLTKAISRICVK